jgi:RNA polymerase sigma-70 factor (ECF subfamily)
VTITTETAWRDFSGPLRRFIAGRAPADAVDDLLSEVFVKVHARIDTLRDEDRLGPWLYQIARNTVADHHRKRHSHGPTLDAIEWEQSEDELDVATRLARGLGPMIDRLPEKYRRALVLTEYEGLTQAEMGRELGLTVSGAKSRVQRARAMLKNELLACCHFEFDSRGRVIDYERRPECCDA